jgi:hypothetical protein
VSNRRSLLAVLRWRRCRNIKKTHSAMAMKPAIPPTTGATMDVLVFELLGSLDPDKLSPVPVSKPGLTQRAIGH